MPKRNKINGMQRYGGVAQLGERHTGSVEVIGSIPTVSTICDGEMSPRKALMNQGLFAFYGIIFKLHVRRCEVGIFPLRMDVNSNQTEYPYKIGR